MNKQYPTKWDNLSTEETFALSKKLEFESTQYLLKECGFSQIVRTADSIYTRGKILGLILPDLFGTRNSRNFFIELKHKNRRIKYLDNGVDIKLVESYLKVEEAFKIPVLLFFKDDQNELNKATPPIEGKFKDNGYDILYGNFLKYLCENTPKNPFTYNTDPTTGSYIYYFPLSLMVKAKDLFKSRQTKMKISEDFD